MDKFTTIHSKVVVLNIENIDTDQIIGSDHLKITDKKGLGIHLFADWRYLDNAEPNPDFVFNQADNASSQVLVAGDNFGCGSSREHAPWALLDFGIKVVISSSIADIFSNNAFKNGLLAIKVSKQQHDFLLANHGAEISVDLKKQLVSCADQQFNFEVEAFSRYCLLNGVDQLDFLLAKMPQIKQYEQKYSKELA
jgi:3-isopropylmalate/(R)-2-methylmalate dehydratase small subunit